MGGKGRLIFKKSSDLKISKNGPGGGTSVPPLQGPILSSNINSRGEGGRGGVFDIYSTALWQAPFFFFWEFFFIRKYSFYSKSHFLTILVTCLSFLVIFGVQLSPLKVGRP